MAETLKDLALRAKVRHNARSGRALADLAQGHGYKIDRTALNNILKGSYSHRPHRSTIEALAWLAGVKEDRVYAAAKLAVPGEPFEPHRDADYLTTLERRAVNNLIQVVTAGRAEANDGDLYLDVAAYDPENDPPDK
ncbi:MAG: hypothetical protein JWO46_2451 [Nocardioidaceae bacterium]|nr:hypothetical protein [Nocardioidaceae bacterium]